jgi:heme a synthase
VFRKVAAIGRRLWQWLPDSIDRRVRVTAWASLVFELALIGTGGAVRLTASGLGCPTWPQCTADSFVNTPAMGIHGVIEFGNRALTGVLAIIVIAAFLAVIRFRRERRDLFVLTLLQGLSIPAQAVLGGISVLTGLNPYVVGLHFVVSILLVIVCAILVWRVYPGGRRVPRAPGWYRATAIAAAIAVGLTVIVGILTTGSGPHAGDNSNPDQLAPRNGLNPELLEHVHSWPAYLTFALTIALLVGAFSLRIRPNWAIALLALELVQIAIGITQSNLGLPIVLVNIHMVLAGSLVAVMTATILHVREPHERSLAG